MNYFITNATGRASSSEFHWIMAGCLACAFHCFLWTFGPLLFLGSLHADTLEATSWATHWDLGYAKHPPLVAWLFKLLLDLPGSRMLNDLLLSQVTVALTAFFIWRTLSLFSSPSVRAFSVFLYLASPPATYFAVQVNHNSLSIPFGAAVLCFGLGFLERRRHSDAVLLGLSAGFGLLAKYQTAFFLISLMLIAVGTPRYRSVWRDPRAYASALLSLAIFAPHLWWDYQHGWTTLRYASADRPLRTFGDFGSSLNELLDGLLMCAAGPTLVWLGLGCPRLRLNRNGQWKSGLAILATPIAILIALGFASGQVMRQGWLIPLIPAVAVGLAVMLSDSVEPIMGQSENASTRLSLLSLGQLLAFAAFLLGRAALGVPVAAYSIDSRLLAEKIDVTWREQATGPIPCLIMPNRSLGLATMLYLDTIPRVVDLIVGPDVADPLVECRSTGGLALMPAGPLFNSEMRTFGLAHSTAMVGAKPAIGPFQWTFEVYAIPPTR